MSQNNPCSKNPLMSKGEKSKEKNHGTSKSQDKKFIIFSILFCFSEGEWKHFCGGNIINKWTILTAAHCTHVADKGVFFNATEGKIISEGLRFL